MGYIKEEYVNWILQKVTINEEAYYMIKINLNYRLQQMHSIHSIDVDRTFTAVDKTMCLSAINVESYNS